MKGGEPLFVLVRYPIDLRSGDADANELLALIRTAEAQSGEKCAWVIVRFSLGANAVCAGHDGKPVRKVRVDDIQKELKRRGVFTLDEKGCVTGSSRNTYSNAKNELTGRRGSFQEEDGQFWRVRPS